MQNLDRKLLVQCGYRCKMQKELFSLQEIDNFLYTSAKSDFSDFDSMSRYLDSIDIALDIKIS